MGAQMSHLADYAAAGLLDAAPDAMVCADRDGHLLLVNSRAEEIFGYHRDDLVGRPLEILVPEAARAVHRELRAVYAAAPRPRAMGTMALAARRRDGSTFPAEISLSALETEDGLVVTAAVRDVTERLAAQAEREQLRIEAERARLERELHQTLRLESLGELAGGVAHDFNNMLSVISSYTAFVAEEVAKHLDSEDGRAILGDIEQVQHAAGRAAGLTRQLLAFARREVVQPRVVDLNAVVAAARKLLSRTLGDNIELVTGLDPALHRVLADPGQIEQVLLILAVNARDAMPGGGKLVIETANVDVDEVYASSRASLSAGRYVALKVSDSGSGMTPEVMERAFEPFFTTKPKGSGSGLGLATVYGIVTQAGGCARIYSEPRHGTTVTVLLPVTEQSPGDAGRPQDALERGGGETVLVVEDESALREVARRILERHGYQVLVAANGREAIDAVTARDEHIDALVTDVVMPGMQGQEVAERVRVLQPDIRVLYMSGYAQGLLGVEGVLQPGVNFIEKPFSEANFVTSVRRVLSGEGAA
jgi:PAS domain S-box-containing protein